MNYILSICIPTYNRCKYLKETLICFINQVQKYKIPIYVSDNCSTDDTLVMLKELKQKYEFLYYKSNVSNLGIDQNIVNSVKMSDSKYVWIFGDDDLIEDCAIEKILSRLENNYDIIVINSSTNDKNFTNTIEKMHLNICQDKFYDSESYEQFLIDTAWYTTFIGSLIVNKILWNSIDYTKYIGTDFVHSGIIYNYIIGRCAYYVSEPLIKIRLQNASWSNRQFEVWMINWPKVIWSLPKEYSISSKNMIVHKKPFCWKTILYYRALGSYDTNIFKKYINENKDIETSKKIIYKLFCFIPKHMAKILIMVKIYLIRPKEYNFQLFQLKNTK